MGSLTAQNKQETHEHLSKNSNVTIHISTQAYVNWFICVNSLIIVSCVLYVNIPYVKYSRKYSHLIIIFLFFLPFYRLCKVYFNL